MLSIPGVYAGRKSDKAIVVRKRANNEPMKAISNSRSGLAEFVERRALAKRKPNRGGV